MKIYHMVFIQSHLHTPNIYTIVYVYIICKYRNLTHNSNICANTLHFFFINQLVYKNFTKILYCNGEYFHQFKNVSIMFGL